MTCPTAHPARPHRFPPFAAAVVLLFVAAGTCRAADPVEPRTWWVELDGGAASVHQAGQLFSAEAPAVADDVGGFFRLGFGHMAGDHLGLGLEFGVIFLGTGGAGENAVLPFQGFVTGRIYPRKHSPFHIRLAGGAFGREAINPAMTSATGLGGEVGVGYDVKLRGYNHLTPYVLYQVGRPGAVRTRAVLVGAAYARW